MIVVKQVTMTENDDTNICINTTRRNIVNKSSYFLKKKNGKVMLSHLA